MAEDIVIRANGLGKNGPRLEHLDMLRGCAAVLVMAGHLRSYVFTNFGSLSEPGIIVKLFYGITGLGHQAVIIFFAMSGFLVGGKALEQMLSRRWYWPSYILRRLSRLWIVIVPALLATFALDQIGMALSGGLGYNGLLYHIYASGPSTDHPINYDLSTFLGNLAFVQTIWVPIFGSNGPIWSLANEFWYYLIFPLAASLALFSYRPQMRLLAATLLVASVLVLPWDLLQPGAIWIAGAVAAWVRKQPRVAPVLRYMSVRLLLLALLAIAVVLTKAPTGGGDLILGMAVALCLPVIAMLPTYGKFYRLCATGAAEISYTLYLTHFPLLTLVIMIGFAPYRFPPSSTGAVVYVGLFILAIAWAMAFWWCFERHTDRLFNYVNARLPFRAVGTRPPGAVSPI